MRPCASSVGPSAWSCLGRGADVARGIRPPCRGPPRPRPPIPRPAPAQRRGGWSVGRRLYNG
eukprot:6560088-Alexandrium_andersonii.AAC.1